MIFLLRDWRYPWTLLEYSCHWQTKINLHMDKMKLISFFSFSKNKLGQEIHSGELLSPTKILLKSDCVSSTKCKRCLFTNLMQKEESNTCKPIRTSFDQCSFKWWMLSIHIWISPTYEQHFNQYFPVEISSYLSIQRFFVDPRIRKEKKKETKELKRENWWNYSTSAHHMCYIGLVEWLK